MGTVKFRGGVDLLAGGKDAGGRAFAGAESWPKLERGAFRLPSGTATQALVIANATPVKVLALECEHPVLLRVGAATATALVGVDGFILVDCNAKTLSCRNATSYGADGNGIRYVVCGG